MPLMLSQTSRTIPLDWAAEFHAGRMVTNKKHARVKLALRGNGTADITYYLFESRFKKTKALFATVFWNSRKNIS